MYAIDESPIVAISKEISSKLKGDEKSFFINRADFFINKIRTDNIHWYLSDLMLSKSSLIPGFEHDLIRVNISQIRLIVINYAKYESFSENQCFAINMIMDSKIESIDLAVGSAHKAIEDSEKVGFNHWSGDLHNWCLRMDSVLVASKIARLISKAIIDEKMGKFSEVCESFVEVIKSLVEDGHVAPQEMGAIFINFLAERSAS